MASNAENVSIWWRQRSWFADEADFWGMPQGLAGARRITSYARCSATRLPVKAHRMNVYSQYLPKYITSNIYSNFDGKYKRSQSYKGTKWACYGGKLACFHRVCWLGESPPRRSSSSRIKLPMGNLRIANLDSDWLVVAKTRRTSKK